MREIHLNTDEQVTDYIERARAIVEASEVPLEWQSIAFAKALDWIAAKQVSAEASDFAPLVPTSPAMHIPRGRVG